MINLEPIVEATLTKWTKKYGNALVASGSLQQNWNLIGSIFNRKLIEDDEKLVVVPAQTGTGKTLFTKTYLAHLLAYSDEPALMVVRERVTAYEVMADINKEANQLCSNHRSTAVACFSDEIDITDKDGNILESGISGKYVWEPETQNAQILIVTHAQLQLAAQEKWRESGSKYSRFDKIYSSISGERKLVIIDEEISLVSGYSLSLEGLDWVDMELTALQRSKYSTRYPKINNDKEFKKQLSNMKYLKRHLTTFEKSKKDEKSWVKLRDEFKSTKTVCDTKELSEYIKGVFWDQIHLRRNNAAMKNEMANEIEQVLAACDVFTRTWSYWEEKDKSAKMTNLLVSTGLSAGAVILDATSTINSSYRLLKEESGLIDCEVAPVRPIKNYSSGSIKICYTSYSGKSMPHTYFNNGLPSASDLSNRTTSICNELRRQFTKEEAATTRMLIVVHKDYEKSTIKKIRKDNLDDYFEEIAVTHWGVIDGKNTYADFNSIFISSVPFLPEQTLTETLMTLIGPDAANYNDIKVKEIKRQLWITSAVSRMIQAINRIGFRRIVDSEGNVKPCQAFVVLPKVNGGEEAKDLLLSALEGIQVDEWDYGYKTTQVKKTPNKKSFQETIVEYASSPKLSGSWSLTEFAMISGLNFGGRPAKICLDDIKNNQSDFYKKLVSLGFSIDVRKTAKKSFVTLSK